MYFYDTNILLSNLDFVKQNGEFVISKTTIAELENIKTSSQKDEAVKFQARQTVKWLHENRNLWTTVNNTMSQKEIDYYLSFWQLPENDGKIIIDVDYYVSNENKDAVFITNDLLCSLYAEQIGLPVLVLKDAETDIYNGYYEVVLDNASYIDIFNKYDNNENPYNLIENQYLIIHCDGKTTEYAYRNNQLKPLKLPKGIKGLNSKQRCVLDLLENENIPIKVICGVYGTGKTYLSINVAVNKVNNSNKSSFSKIFLVRQPYGEGEEIGFLKGTKDDKIRDFFNPILDNIEGGEFTMRMMMENGQLEADVPFYMKGRSLSSTMVLVDEAEDLTLKQIKLLGSRIANNSNIIFIGDWKQAAGKYEWNCGLVQFINYVKQNPNPLVGVMVMDEDVRSDASKYFAEI